MRAFFVLLAASLFGCARAAPDAARHSAPANDATYEHVGTKSIFMTGEAGPRPPVYALKGPLVPTPGSNAALPRFGGEDAIPAALPAFVGSAIQGADGIAPQTADKIVLLALLKARRFADLDRCFDDLQTVFELDARKEHWPSDALDAFRTGDAGIGALVQEWVAASPKSWAALAARGAHRHALAWLVRGGGFASSVTEAAGLAFQRQEAEAAADLRAALARRARFVAAHAVLIAVYRGTPQARAVLNESLKTCPSCFQPRSAYLDGLTPEWGGSYEEMNSFVRESLAASGNLRLKLLAGFAPYSRALKLRDDKRPIEAMSEINEALRAGDLWRVYLVRANISSNLGQRAAALSDLDRAFELKPQAAPLADFRGAVRARLGLVEGAIEDFDLARKLDPTRPRPEEYAQVADELVRRSNAVLAAGGTERSDALRDLAGHLREASSAPDPRGAPVPSPAVVPAEAAPDPYTAFRGQLASLPDDYASYRRLSFPLLNGHRTRELEELWTAWIERHPDDARGYAGRADAFSQVRDIDRRDADLSRACELGDAPACARRDLNTAVRARAGAGS